MSEGETFAYWTVNGNKIEGNTFETLASAVEIVAVIENESILQREY